jgi:hypothetical protein
VCGELRSPRMPGATLLNISADWRGTATFALGGRADANRLPVRCPRQVRASKESAAPRPVARTDSDCLGVSPMRGRWNFVFMLVAGCAAKLVQPRPNPALQGCAQYGRSVAWTLDMRTLQFTSKALKKDIPSQSRGLPTAMPARDGVCICHLPHRRRRYRNSETASRLSDGLREAALADSAASCVIDCRLYQSAWEG